MDVFCTAFSIAPASVSVVLSVKAEDLSVAMLLFQIESVGMLGFLAKS
jgi:hypothetical protein